LESELGVTERTVAVGTYHWVTAVSKIVLFELTYALIMDVPVVVENNMASAWPFSSVVDWATRKLPGPLCLVQVTPMPDRGLPLASETLAVKV
jgi:hypothetical protein